MKTHRIAAVLLLSILACLLAADKEPKQHRYTSDGTRTDKVTQIAIGDDDDSAQVRDAKTISGWIEQAMKARTPQNRRRAITTLDLIAVEAKEANEPIPERDVMAAGLVKALSDKDSEVRSAAITALETAGTDASTSGLAKVLQSDSDDLNRMYAAAALGNLKATPSIRALETAARSKAQKEHVRRAAIASLGKIGGEQAKAALGGIAKIVPAELSDDVDKALDQVEGLAK